MKNFANLIQEIDSTNKTNDKVNALKTYFDKTDNKDKLWAIAVLSHRRPPRPIKTTLVRKYAAELAQIPEWLFEESYHIVGDLAETVALVLPQHNQSTTKAFHQYLEDFISLKNKTDEEKKEYLHINWLQLNYYERFVFTKLITGGFRIGVSQKLMTRALSKSTGIATDILAYKLMGNWTPMHTTFKALIYKDNPKDNVSRPYPFCLANAITKEVHTLGKPQEYLFEYKWDGIRAQIIYREGKVFIWTRGEELVTNTFPELQLLKSVLPEGTVLDGEILAFPNQKIGDFKQLQQRINRKTISKSLLQQIPVIFKAYDILEWQAQDIRSKPFHERRKILDKLYHQQVSNINVFQLSFILKYKSWDAVEKERKNAREKKAEGLMVKHALSPYGIGRKKGLWWKHKTDPYTIDAVLTYAMRGHGRRNNLFTDYTFALWDDTKNELITFAKAYTGLTDKELKTIDKWVKQNTIERFGPVVGVHPKLVFEIAFEGIAVSKRHKSGISTRFPRILRWRTDKKAKEANTLKELKNLIK